MVLLIYFRELSKVKESKDQSIGERGEDERWEKMWQKTFQNKNCYSLTSTPVAYSVSLSNFAIDVEVDLSVMKWLKKQFR